MSEHKGTPGPWETQTVIQEGDDRGTVYIIGANLGGLVGAAHAWPTEIDSGDFSRVEANARMLAAASELHDTLYELLYAEQQLDDYASLSRDEQDRAINREIAARSQAIEALEQARGEKFQAEGAQP